MPACLEANVAAVAAALQVRSYVDYLLSVLLSQVK